jgi:hypothetical protein
MVTPCISQPVAGFYSLRVCKNGPNVPVRFWRDGAGEWSVEVDGMRQHTDGTPLDPYEIWPFAGGREITQSEFEFLIRRRLWALAHDPNHPAANPFQPVDLRKMKPRW